MLHLVDGYNITRADPETRGLSLAAQRDALVARVRARGQGLLGPGRIVIVFDGEGGAGASTLPGTPVEVRFSRSGSADDVLAGIAAKAEGKICLVSSDRALADRVRTHAPHGCEIRPKETLFEAARPRRSRRGKAPYPARTAGLPAGANSITEELKRHWLEEEG